MSGPTDSGSADAPTKDSKLTPLDLDATPTLSQRFRLKMVWDTPHLEWKPIKGFDSSKPGAPPPPPPPPPPNPERAFKAMERYLNGGGYLFDLNRADWGPVDRAFQFAPTDPPNYSPSLAQVMGWQEDTFYRRLGNTSIMFQSGGTPPMLPMTPLAPPSLFSKPPPPPPLYGEAPLARPGKVGDALKATFNLPVTQRLKTLASDELTRQYNSFVRDDWDKWSGWQKGTAIAFAGVFVAGVVGAAAAVPEARHVAAKNVLGMEVPLYLIDQHLSFFRVPGTSFRIDGFGAARDALVGRPPGPAQPPEFKITVLIDVPEAFRVIAGHF